ncbi:glucose PTS transporter subunit IIA [Clostridium ganghwense]|uniref:Glucose PTS transporter subunit IIA n=1 Tax=Clostridium ganghwense TaxID=312089 RepID=A0ABT4CR16_9CLOT|nr:glucose PTS transporter subunit IIA [Clostridium ganghwense]MCY6370439.1 glucose PTS transporter subunit IIA [Clostridium ganghwense]
MNKSKGGKFFAVLQKIGKSLMLPVSVLPAAGILLRLGQNDLLGQYGAVFQNLATAGDAIFGNLPIIFAVGVAIGFSGGEAVAALAAVVGQLILQAIIKATGSRLDITINMGIFGGIVVGLIAAILYNKYHNIKLPQVLGFFGGKRFVPIITSVAALIFAVIGVTIWPTIQNSIDVFAKWASTSILGPAFYAGGKRLLIPVGLHHMYYPPFLFQFGEFVSNGVTYFGDSARYFHGDPTAGVFMAAEYPILMFGLPGAALAMIAASKPENRRKISGMLISAAFVSFLTGITEPIEFSFIFVAPILFVFHVLAAFASGIITSLLKIRLGYTFSASAIDYVLGFKFAGHPWLIWVVGIAFFTLYFAIFYFTIKAKDIKTPGREDKEEYDVQSVNAKGSDKAARVIEAVGGKDNIEAIDACITRLRMTLKDSSAVDKKALKALGAAGILKAADSIQAIFGTDAEKIKDDIKDIIARRGFYEWNGKEEAAVEDNERDFMEKSAIQIQNPINGKIITIDKVPDEVFAEKLLGDGFAIKPEGNKVFSPIDGEIAVLFPTKHAIAINSEKGLEILVHIGIDTVRLNGQGFTTYVEKGDKVKKGDLLISFDEVIVKEKAKSLITPVIVTNMEKVLEIYVQYGDKVSGELVAMVKTK